MDKLLLYFGESLVLLGIFYCAFWLVLRKSIHHRLSRFYLLVSLVLALLLPLHLVSFQLTGHERISNSTMASVINAKKSYRTVVASITKNPGHFKSNKAESNDFGITNTGTATARSHMRPVFSVYNLAGLIYFVGLGIFLIRLLLQIYRLRLQIRSSRTKKIGEIIFVYIKEACCPYSFGNYLFVPESIENTSDFNSILEHEKTHIRQKHTYDVLFIELISVVFWMNPFVWLLRNSLRKVHEYLADEQVIRNGCDSQSYQTLLLEKIIYVQPIGLTSSFHFKPIKQRLAMIKNLSKTIPGKIRFMQGIPKFVAIALALLIVAVISCTSQKEKVFQLLKIQGEGAYYNFSNSNIGYILGADSVSPTAMLVQYGDVLGANDDIIYYTNKTSYNFSSENEGILLNNGKVFAISLSNKPAIEAWLQQLNTLDLSDLDHIVLSDKLPADYIEYLQKIAEKNKKIGLSFDVWNEEMADVVNFFEPTWLVVSGIQPQQLEQLSGLPQLEMLLLSIDDGPVSEQLPVLPKLKHLLLSDLKSHSIITNDFLSQNPQIETVVCADCAISDFDFLNELKNLNSLMVLNTDAILDLHFLSKHKSLSRLSILVDEAVDWSLLSQCSNLKWLTLSGNISQSEFDEVINKNADLEVVEMIECDSLNSLTVLKGLNTLKALTVSDTLRDASTLLQLGTLEYLSLPEESLSDTVYAAKLQAAIPKAVIVPNEGFCMGSGWFIFFIPAVLGIALLRKKLVLKKKRMTT